MPNDILKVSDKRVLVAGPITSYSYEVGYTYTSQGASICFLTPDIDKARRICDTLNESRELYKNHGRAAFSPLENKIEHLDKNVSTAIQYIHGLDIYIDALNFFDPTTIPQELPVTILEKTSEILSERLRGRLILLIDNSFSHSQQHSPFMEFRKISSHWYENHKNQLLQKNILAHQMNITLTEDSLLFLDPHKTINESLKTLNEKQNLNLKITKPDNISKLLMALTSDLSSSLFPSLLYTQ